MRTLSVALALAGMIFPVRATTLEKLPLDEMIRKSTSIVRAKVVNSYGALRGQDIYTYYQVQVLESLKPAQPGGTQQIEVAVPGGMAGGLRQMVAGAPALNPGTEYVLFLWTSRSGLTQVIGLSQGLFQVAQNASGTIMVARPAASELMLDASGRPVDDKAVTMPLSDFRAVILKTSAGGK